MRTWFQIACSLAALAQADCQTQHNNVAYGYAVGGDDWGEIKDANSQVAFPDCSNGKKQSPINFKATNVKKTENLDIHLYGY